MTTPKNDRDRLAWIERKASAFSCVDRDELLWMIAEVKRLREENRGLQRSLSEENEMVRHLLDEQESEG